MLKFPEHVNKNRVGSYCIECFNQLRRSDDDWFCDSQVCIRFGLVTKFCLSREEARRLRPSLAQKHRRKEKYD